MHRAASRDTDKASDQNKHIAFIRSNVWISSPECPLSYHAIRQLLMLTGRESRKSERSSPTRDIYTIESPPPPFSELELVAVKREPCVQFQGSVDRTLSYPEAKRAWRMLNNWLSGIANNETNCIAIVPLGKPWETLVESDAFRFSGTPAEFLVNLTSVYGHGIEVTNDQAAQALENNLVCAPQPLGCIVASAKRPVATQHIQPRAVHSPLPCQIIKATHAQCPKGNHGPRYFRPCLCQNHRYRQSICVETSD